MTKQSIHRFLVLLVLNIFAIVFLAQAATQDLPFDKEVRTGKLSNGLTYFIRHNAQTPGIAEFYIAHRVGSILEQPHQRGLAHFLEHMAFNGTVNFPDGNDGKRGIRPWCERNGIKFGADLNASTSVEQTIYKICNVPVSKAGVTDTCLLILHDWSGSLLLKDEEIDKERGVIHEEWRTRRASRAVQRMMENALPTIYEGSKYENCMPIGTMEVVDNFPYSALRDFYKSWYRPDLQAVIVVGDIDVNEMENKIKTLFSPIPAAKADAPKRTYFPVGDNKEMIVYTETDNEQPTVNFSLYMKRGEDNTNPTLTTREDFVEGYKSRLAMFMLRQRIMLLSQDAQPRVMSCSVRDGAFYITSAKDAFALTIGLFPDKLQEGIDAALSIVEKTREYGFTEDELDRAKQQYTLSIEHKRAQKGKERNSEFVQKILNHFLNFEPLMSIDDEADLEAELEATISLEEVNAKIKEIVTNDNQVCIVYGPTKWNGSDYALPSHDTLRTWIEQAERRSYENDLSISVVDRTYIKKLPKKGKIVSKKESTNGYTEYLLSNGIRVFARPSGIEPKRLTIQMFRLGGRSLYLDEDATNLSLLGTVVSNSGVADYDRITLEKKRAGKALRVTPYIDGDEEGVKGVCAASDLKTWLELCYLYLTNPRRDEAVFSNTIERQRSLIKNRNANPNVSYNDSLRLAIYGKSLRTLPINEERLNSVSLDRIYEIYKERFSDLSGMNLLITGDIRTDEFEQLICQYVASLPAKKKKVSHLPGKNQLDIRRVNDTHVFSLPQHTPSVLTNIVYTIDMPYTAQSDLEMDVLAQLLRMAYTDKVREEKGGTYGVSVNSQCWSFPTPAASLTINFRTNTEKFDEVLPIIDDVIREMAKNGPSEQDLQKIKEYELKNYDRAVLTNGYWEYVKYHELRDGIDFDKDYRSLVNALSTKNISYLCKRILEQNNRIQVTMK